MTEFVIPTLIISGVYLATYIAWTAVDLIKKRRKNRLLQKLVVYGDTETRLLYIQRPLPDSPETLRERRRSLSQWLGSRATDDVWVAPNTLRALQGYPEAEELYLRMIRAMESYPDRD